MVNALSRRPPEAVIESISAEKINCTIPNDQLSSGNNKFPCALREFINSNADLPTIDELAKRSKQLAIAMGMLD